MKTKPLHFSLCKCQQLSLRSHTRELCGWGHRVGRQGSKRLSSLVCVCVCCVPAPLSLCKQHVDTSLKQISSLCKLCESLRRTKYKTHTSSVPWVLIVAACRSQFDPLTITHILWVTFHHVTYIMHKNDSTHHFYIKLNIRDQHIAHNIGKSQMTSCSLKCTVSDWLSHAIGSPSEMCAIQGTGHDLSTRHKDRTQWGHGALWPKWSCVMNMSPIVWKTHTRDATSEEILTKLQSRLQQHTEWNTSKYSHMHNHTHMGGSWDSWPLGTERQRAPPPLLHRSKVHWLCGGFASVCSC